MEKGRRKVCYSKLTLNLFACIKKTDNVLFLLCVGNLAHLLFVHYIVVFK
jgi:hypothetical protein